ncbi:MAG: hypothetical protein AAF772_15060 [Acidobacteriota bacterium]
MLRWLILIGLAFLLARVLDRGVRQLLRSATPNTTSAARSARAPTAQSIVLVGCVRCGRHVPRARTRRARAGELDAAHARVGGRSPRVCIDDACADR